MDHRTEPLWASLVSTRVHPLGYATSTQHCAGGAAVTVAVPQEELNWSPWCLFPCAVKSPPFSLLV